MRLLLLEFRNADALRRHRAELLPFVAGLGELRAWTIAWWVVELAPDEMHAAGRFTVGLAEARQEDLVARLAGFSPDVVLRNDDVAEPLLRALHATLPGVRLLTVDGSFPGHVRVDEAVDAIEGPGAFAARPADGLDGAATLVDAVAPAFRWLELDPPVDAGNPPVLRLAGNRLCPYARPIARNPHYAGLDTPAVQQQRGCAFCGRALDRLSGRELLRPYRTPPLALALRQIVAHQADRPGEAAYGYLWDDPALHAQLEELAGELLARGVRPSTLYLMFRVDDLLAQRAALEAALPLLARGGHRLRLVSVGVENFSDRENERFNKGLTAAQVWACHDLILELRRRFPGTFDVEGPSPFVGILFTPWTTPADLRVNLEAGRRLGPGWVEAALKSRLQLREGAAITDLARRDGLAGPEHRDATELEARCLSSPSEGELPWRFADARTELAARLLVRLDALLATASAGDDDVGRVVARLRRAVPASLAGDLVELSLAFVDAVEALPEGATPQQVCEHIARASWQGTPGPSHADLGERGARQLAHALRVLDHRRPSPFEGFRCTGAEPVREGTTWAVRATFRRDDGGATSLRVLAGGGIAEAWCRSGHVAVVYGGDGTPAAREERLARVVLALAEKVCPLGVA